MNPNFTVAEPKEVKREKIESNSYLSSYKLFIVDDDIMIRKALQRIFAANKDFQHWSFATGEDCVESLFEAPDIIILDYHLSVFEDDDSVMNGLDVLEKIKEINPEIKVVMLSSQNNIEVAVESLKKGAMDYVVKDEVMTVNVEKAVLNVIKSMELKEEINKLSETIKRDKLLMRGYGLIILALFLVLFYFFMN